jgi:carbon storage regulator
MLVLSRKPGEKVIIGNSIAVTVVEIKGNRVRIGFDAPNEVRIFRVELDGDNAAESALRHGEIRRCAYRKWDAAGKPRGDGVNFWLEAERELSQAK